MLGWLANTVATAAVEFAVWMLVLTPLLRFARRGLADLMDRLDPSTPGGLGEIERRLREIERRLGGETR